MTLRQLGHSGAIGPIADVTLLGYDAEIRWGQETTRCDAHPGYNGVLRVLLPETLPSKHACALRVRFA